jgi:hypothetical protein
MALHCPSPPDLKSHASEIRRLRVAEQAMSESGQSKDHKYTEAGKRRCFVHSSSQKGSARRQILWNVIPDIGEDTDIFVHTFRLRDDLLPPAIVKTIKFVPGIDKKKAFQQFQSTP